LGCFYFSLLTSIQIFSKMNGLEIRRKQVILMEECTVVAVDAMGGDNAPVEIVKGAVDAVNKSDRVQVILTGPKGIIQDLLSNYTYDSEKITVEDATEVITTEEAPVIAIRKKKNSSLVVGQQLVKDGRADAFVSAGSTGAVLAGGMFVVGRIKGVERPPLGTLIPTKDGVALLADSGANVDSRASHLVQFARMGSIYMEHVVGIKNPRVAIANIGVEEEKGNALVKETRPLLQACEDINFIGSIESREIPRGGADVIVCDGFAGNLMLKLYEGVGDVLLSKVKSGMMENLRSKIGALLIKPALKKTLKSFDASEYGGAPMLGLNGLVVKTHGSSKANEITNSILQCIAFKEQKISDKIRLSLGTKE
jgi:glycerol-3-phosphate acyltransferase PlsX